MTVIDRIYPKQKRKHAAPEPGSTEEAELAIAAAMPLSPENIPVAIPRGLTV